uniref:Uncharacterized protein n=1 Tax=Arion vulgaris TaxID=1028688 RepID=A0A0B7BFW4_9EUPU
MNTSVDIDNSERNMNSFNTIQCLGNMNEKINEDLSKSNISDVGKRIEHQKTNTPSKQSTELATSPVVCNNMDTDCSSEPVSSSSQNMVKEKSFSERNLSQLHLSSLESMSKACKQQEEQEASDNIDMLDKTAIVTTLEAAGIESLSLRSVEGTKISNLESHPVLPSQVHFPSNIPETPVSPVWETPMVAVTTAETPRHEKLSCNNFKPQSSISKQENRGHHKNMSVKNGMRGMKPLHPLQIPPYSYTDHDVNSQSQQVFHNARSSSLYHPYFWQWPVHTPGSDPAVSPLNLCTTQKSPNNYSPITPTSPLSPNYPTQGATESSLSPQAKIGGKPLWYPWLKINSARSETKIGCHTSPADHIRHYRSKNELEHTYESFSREPAQMESRKVKHDTRINSKLQKHSPRRFQSQFSWSKPASLKINETISNSATISNFLGRVIKTAHKLGNRNLPSTSNSENLKDVSLKTVSETSGNVAFEAKQRFRFRKNGGQCRIANSAHWSGDTATIPDSLDICHSYKSSPSLSNDNNSRISEATEKRRKLCSEGSNITTKCGTEHERLRSKLKNMRKPKGKFKLSTPASQPTCSTDFEHSNDHEQFRLTDCVGNQLIKDGDKLEYCHKKTADISGSNPLQTSILKRSNKRLYDDLYSQDDSPQKCGRNVNDDQESISYRYGKEEKPICQSGDLTYPVKSPP